MTQKNLITVFCSAVMAAVVLPQVILAQNLGEISPQDQEKYQELSQYETQTLLQDVVPQALTDNWVSQIVSGSSDRFSPAVSLTLRSFVRHNFSRYLLTDVPLDAAKTIILQGIEIGRIVLSNDWDGAVAGILSKFEKDSVAAAVSYAKSELFKYQIKMATGAFEAQYSSQEGSQEKALLQYVVVYKADGDDKADVSIRIYSIEAINPSESRMSIGGTTGVVHNLQPGEKIPSFTVTFSGTVNKAQYGGTAYSWDGDPKVDISFPDSVPDFGFRPVSWLDRNIVNPIKDAIGSVGNFLNGIGQSIGSLFGAQIVAVSNSGTEQTDEAWSEETLSINPGSSLLNGVADKQALQNNTDNVSSTSDSSASNQGRYRILSDPATGNSSQLGVSASIEAPSSEDTEPSIGQLTDQEREEIMRNIVLELVRRQQEQQSQLQAEEQQAQLRAGLIAIVEELQRRQAEIQNNSVEDESDDSELDQDQIESDETEPSSSSDSATADLCLVQSGQVAQMNKVIINEVAWMGTAASANHEWIELKNLTGQAVSLSGWQLQDKDQQIKVIFGSSSQIGSNQFFLLERTSDDSVPGIKAGLTYTGALGNSNEALYLFNPDCQLQDKVEATPSWPAGNDSQKRTMERGTDLSWHTYSGIGQNNIFGTPKAANGPAAQQSSGGGNNNSSGNGGGTPTGGSSGQQPQPPPVQAQNQEPASEPQAISHLIISEIMLADSLAREYVELYNPTDQEVNLCADASTALYFAYYPAARDWNNPYRIKSFCSSPSSTAAVISAKGYYLISFNGWPEAQSDWPMYSSDLLSDSSGAIAIFSGDPRNATGTAEEISASIAGIKIDAAGWKKTASSTEPLVKETAAALVPDQAGQALGRLWHIASQKYQDTDDNFKDFGNYNPSPSDSLSYAPEAITDLSVQVLAGRKNGARLVWSAPNDKDTGPDQLSYQIFYSRGQAFSTGTMAEIEDETEQLIINAGDEVTADISGLYYDSAYYFAVQAIDDKDNVSPLSNSTQAFDIDKANHPWPMARHDAGLTNQGDLGGPVDGWQVLDFTGSGGKFFVPPVIDENGSAYLAADIGGDEGIYAFDAGGKQEWFFQTASGRIPALSNKGLVYFFAPYGAGALSPSGRFKWSENFNTIYSANPVAGPDGNFYLIAKTESQAAPHLLALADGETQPIKAIDYDLSQELDAGEAFTSALGPMLDSQGNIYLAVNRKIIKLDSLGQKIEERFFEPEYGEDYEGSRDVVASAGLPYLLGNNQLITIVGNGHCGKLAASNGGPAYDGCESMIYSLSLEDLDSENWKKAINPSDWADVMGSNLYFTSRGSSMWGSGWLNLTAIDLSSGDTVWSKKWSNDYGPNEIYPLLADGQNRAYFAQNDRVLGYDLGQVLDNSSASGQIFSAAASNATSNAGGGSLGPGGLFAPARERMSLIQP